MRAEALPPFLRDGGLGQERLGVGGEDMAGDLKQAIRVAEDASGTALHRANGSHFPKTAAKQKTSPSCFVRQLSSQEEPWQNRKALRIAKKCGVAAAMTERLRIG